MIPSPKMGHCNSVTLVSLVEYEHYLNFSFLTLSLCEGMWQPVFLLNQVWDRRNRAEGGAQRWALNLKLAFILFRFLVRFFQDNKKEVVLLFAPLDYVYLLRQYTITILSVSTLWAHQQTLLAKIWFFNPPTKRLPTKQDRSKFRAIFFGRVIAELYICCYT